MTRMTELRQSMILFFRVIVCAAFLLMMAELLSSCEHKDLCYDHPHRQNVEVMFDWSADPDANPATMSLYLYPEEGGDPIRYEFTDKNGGNISVAAGTYRAICVNSDKETHRILGKERFETFQRRQRAETFAEALHAAAFVVHRDHQARAHRPDRRRQRPQLAWLGVVAGKQDHAADQRVLQDLALLGADFVADHVEHDGTGGAMGWLHGFSMTAKATT